jgi:hypothetical protein
MKGKGRCLTSSLYWQRNPSGARSGLLGKDQATETRIGKLNIETAADTITVADYKVQMLNAVLNKRLFKKTFKSVTLQLCYKHGLDIDLPSIQISKEM